MYIFENKRVKFYKYQNTDSEGSVFYSNTKNQTSVQLDLTNYLWIEEIDFDSNCTVNALLKQPMDKKLAIDCLTILLNRTDWKYNKNILDKINEFKLLGLDSNLDPEFLKDFIKIRQYIYECIEYYNK